MSKKSSVANERSQLRQGRDSNLSSHGNHNPSNPRNPSPSYPGNPCCSHHGTFSQKKQCVDQVGAVGSALLQEAPCLPSR